MMAIGFSLKHLRHVWYRASRTHIEGKAADYAPNQALGQRRTSEPLSWIWRDEEPTSTSNVPGWARQLFAAGS